MYWLYLILAISFEVMGTLSIKQTSVTNSYYWGAFVALCYMTSFFFLGLAVKKIDLGTAYAIWAGMGTTSIVVLSWLFFHENMSALKVSAIALILVGSVILKYQHA